MNFAQFQATKRSSDDLGKELSDARWEGEPAAQGFMYEGDLYIEKVLPHWPEASRKRGAYALGIGRDDWISDDLEGLERRLYDFALSEEIITA